MFPTARSSGWSWSTDKGNDVGVIIGACVSFVSIHQGSLRKSPDIYGMRTITMAIAGY
jgi:hypothetical protein